jgi:hypothetical protein
VQYFCIFTEFVTEFPSAFTTTTPMIFIPIELYPSIAEHVSQNDPGSLVGLSLVSGAFNYAAEVVMYRRVAFRYDTGYPEDLTPAESRNWLTFWTSVTHQKRSRVLCVQHLYIGYSKDLTTYEGSTDMVSDAIKQFVNLRTLVLVDGLNGGREALFREARFASLLRFGCFDVGPLTDPIGLKDRNAFFSFVREHPLLNHVEIEMESWDDHDRQRWMALQKMEDPQMLPGLRSLAVEADDLFILLPACVNATTLHLKLYLATAGRLPGTAYRDPGIFRQLETLKIEYRAGRWNDGDLEVWYGAILPFLSSLKVLDLRFRYSSQIEVLRRLATMIPQIPSCSLKGVKIFLLGTDSTAQRRYDSVSRWLNDVMPIAAPWFDAFGTLDSIEFGWIQETDMVDLVEGEIQGCTHDFRRGVDGPILRIIGPGQQN